MNNTDNKDGPEPSISNILIVDDDASLRQLLELVLTSQGYNVKVAEHGADAIPIVEATKFDLIYLDIMMPVMDGVEFLTWFRKRDATTPVIAFTSLVRHEIKEKLESINVTGILYKPAAFENILEVTAKIIGNPENQV